jgi:putative phosphoribosyl transferase
MRFPDVCRPMRVGRPDLAGEALSLVKAPTLLMVAGEDALVIGVNRDALDQLRVQARIEIVPGATHLFEERGTLARVANLARLWFSRYLEARFGRAVPRTSCSPAAATSAAPVPMLAPK